MDADSSESGAVVTDSLNGETKPDPAKLAQSAIIKQDVMLSGTSTQSPVSSVLAMPTISMPGASMPTVSMGNTSLHASLPDSLFLSAVPSLGNDGLHSVSDAKHDLAASQTASVLSQQLLGQPQVAPQLIMTGQGLHGQPSAASAASVPVQQLLIPVSTGNGTQQFVSIPVSLAPGSNQQIQLLTTSNGQLIATNLASLTQQLSMALGNTAHRTSTSTTASHTPSLSVNSGHVTHSHQSSSQAAAAAAASTALPQLITNSQGQIIALGSSAQQGSQSTKHVSHGSFNHLLQQQQLQQALATTTASTATPTTLHQNSAHSSSLSSTAQMALTQQVLQAAVGASMPVTQVAQSIKQSLTSLSHSGLQSVTLPQPHSLKMAPMAAAVAAQNIQAAVATQPSAAMVQQQVVAAVTQSSTNHSLPPNVNQLLPNTVSNSTESTTVDGINLDEIKEFAKQFKIRRLSLGLTQTQVGQALSATEGPAYSQSAICSDATEGRHYSQSAICRFEKLDITPKSAQKIKPVLEKWMKEAEERYKNGVQNLTEFIGSEPSKKRKRRTSFTPQAIEILNEFFERNTHPSGAEMTELAEKLNYDREVIRVWFCNKRQALKNTIKKLKS